MWVSIRARQLKIYFQGSRVGGNIDQIEPLRLGPMSFTSKLMDRGDLKVYYYKLVVRNQKMQNPSLEEGFQLKINIIILIVYYLHVFQAFRPKSMNL